MSSYDNAPVQPTWKTAVWLCSAPTWRTLLLTLPPTFAVMFYLLATGHDLESAQGMELLNAISSLISLFIFPVVIYRGLTKGFGKFRIAVEGKTDA